MKTMDLSVIIISHNTRELTANAVESVLRSNTRYRFEVIVVDNASTDGSAEAIAARFPEVRLVRNAKNVGFARANNQAIRLARGRYILLLNSDTVVRPDTFETMLDFMEAHPRVGAAGCKVLLPDGSLDKACRRGFPTPAASFYYVFGLARLFPKSARFNAYHLGHLDPDTDHPVDCLVGAFMLVRRETIGQVGLLDERFFMYGEDVDWCFRIRQAGWDIHYWPRTSIVHYKRASWGRRPARVIREFHRSMWLFHRKHFAARYPFYVNALVGLGIGVRLAGALVKNGFLARLGGRRR